MGHDLRERFLRVLRTLLHTMRQGSDFEKPLPLPTWKAQHLRSWVGPVCEQGHHLAFGTATTPMRKVICFVEYIILFVRSGAKLQDANKRIGAIT